MSHDIRTPMNAIIGFTSLAATHLEDPERLKGYLSKIMVSSNHLLSLINDVLDMSRIESGKVKIEENECSIPVVMHDLRNILQSDIKAKRLDFFIDTVDVVNEDVICDKLRRNQTLSDGCPDAGNGRLRSNKTDPKTGKSGDRIEADHSHDSQCL